MILRKTQRIKTRFPPENRSSATHDFLTYVYSVRMYVYIIYHDITYAQPARNLFVRFAFNAAAAAATSTSAVLFITFISIRHGRGMTYTRVNRTGPCEYVFRYYRIQTVVIFQLKSQNKTLSADSMVFSRFFVWFIFACRVVPGSISFGPESVIPLSRYVEKTNKTKFSKFRFPQTDCHSSFSF